MKSIYLTRNGQSSGAFEIREEAIPIPKANEVVIKVKVMGINFADILIRRGLYPDPPPLPAVIGYDVAGIVHAVGDDVTHVKEGQRVATLTRFGGYSEYAITLGEGVAPIPDDMSYEVAASLAVQGSTAYYCAEESVQLHEGDHVLIQAAAGGVGSMMVQYAKHKGCIVFGTASTLKQDYLREIGVDYPIDYTKKDFADVIVKQLNGKKQLDVVFDSMGGIPFKKAMKILGQGGRMVCIGAATQMDAGKKSLLKTLKVGYGFGIFSPIQLLTNSQAIIAVNMLRIGDYRPKVFQHVLNQVINLTAERVFKPHIDKSFKADQVADAHEYIEQRKSKGKVVMTW